MAGRKRTPCDFCENENWDSEEGTGKHQLYYEIYPENNVMYFTSYAENQETGETEELGIEIPLNYCPVCGRKLN